jgi:hypothetical protein
VASPAHYCGSLCPEKCDHSNDTAMGKSSRGSTEGVGPFTAHLARRPIDGGREIHCLKSGPAIYTRLPGPPRTPAWGPYPAPYRFRGRFQNHFLLAAGDRRLCPEKAKHFSPATAGAAWGAQFMGIYAVARVFLRGSFSS